jgi:UPF0271 protein
MKKQLFIIDTSAILSGKPINIASENMVTTSSVSDEFKPGGKDYRNFQFLKEKGLLAKLPSKESISLIKSSAEETGDLYRLSSADIEILALALEVNNEKNKEAVILTDDYSIQNVANSLNIKFQSISQRGITKKFKWLYRCPGCGKQFKESIRICPICGTETKISIGNKYQMK